MSNKIIISFLVLASCQFSKILECVYCSKEMSQQHNSHVANGTDQTIKIVLTDNNNRNTSQIIEDGNHCCIPTKHGKVTLSVFPEEPQGNAFVTTSVASLKNDSDHSFIVKKDNTGRINIYRAKYGTIWLIESGLRQTNTV